MKKAKNNGNLLKVILIILIVLILSLISFVGIYVKENGNYSNLIKDYKLAMELEGNRTLILKPDTSTETVVKDSNGNIIEDATEEEITNNGYVKEEVPINDGSILTEENFKKSKKIFENRLDKINFEEYFIRQDLDNGNIIIELAENENIDTILSMLNQQGKFEIKDSQTKEVLMDNSMIKTAKVMYNTTTSGTSVYLDIEFNKDGAKKLEQISNDYKTIDNSESSEESESSDNSEESNSQETTQEQKEISIDLNGESITTTSFDEPIENGSIQLTIGQATTDTDKIQQYVQQASSTATILSEGETPIKYTADTNKYIKTSTLSENLKIMLIICLVIIALVTVGLIIKYKLKGLISGILSIGYIAITLLVIRYTNVQISIAGLAGIATIIILNYILQVNILKNSNASEENRKKISNIFGKHILTIFPIFIIALTFTFATSALLNSFGMILFWGIILELIYNAIFAKIYEN